MKNIKIKILVFAYNVLRLCKVALQKKVWQLSIAIEVARLKNKKENFRVEESHYQCGWGTMKPKKDEDGNFIGYECIGHKGVPPANLFKRRVPYQS